MQDERDMFQLADAQLDREAALAQRNEEWINARAALAKAANITIDQAEVIMVAAESGEPVDVHAVLDLTPSLKDVSKKPKRVLLFVGGEGVDVPPDWAEHIQDVLRREIRFCLGKSFKVILVKEDEDLQAQAYGFFERDWDAEYVAGSYGMDGL